MLRKLLNLFGKEKLIDKAHSKLINMLREDKLMFLEARRSLRNSDTAELEFDLWEKDRQINKDLMDVRKKVITHLSLQPGFDVPAALILTSIVIDVERIGDYCKNIAELAGIHPTRLQLGQFESQIVEIEDSVGLRFDTTISALEKLDSEVASKALEGHKKITSLCDSIVRTIVVGKAENLSPSEHASLVLYMRYLKRTAGHLSNIASSIVNPFTRIGFRPDGTELESD